MPEEAWLRLAHALETPSRIDQRVLDDLEQMTVTLSRVEREIAVPRVALGAITAHMDTLATLLRSSLPPAARSRLCSLAAETAGLVGWLRWDHGEYDAAASLFRAGIRAAQEAGDPALVAYLTGSVACRPLYMEEPAVRLSWLEDGRAAACATPHTRAWLLTMEANAWAMLGNRHQFLALTERSRELLAQPDDDGARRPRVPFFTRAYHAEEAAAGLLRLNLPNLARQTLAPAMEEATGRIRLWMMLDQAVVALEEGEPELACELAHATLDEVEPAGVEPILANLRALARDMGMYGQMPEVAELRERARLA